MNCESKGHEFVYRIKLNKQSWKVVISCNRCLKVLNVDGEKEPWLINFYNEELSKMLCFVDGETQKRLPDLNRRSYKNVFKEFNI